MKWIKQNIDFVVLLVIGIIIYQKLFPNIEIQTITKYKKGITDTLVVTKNVTKYLTKYVTKTDTFYADSAGEHASALFNLQNSIVTGVVQYDTPDFSFRNVKIKQKIINKYINRVDTLRIETTKIIRNKFHIGLIGGYGVGLQDSKFQPFVGVGFSWELF